MEGQKYSDVFLIVVYAVMAFCWAGKFGYTFINMCLSGVAGFVLGLFMIMCEKFKLPAYVSRFFASAAAVISVLIMSVYFKYYNTYFDIIAATVLPVASGSTLIEGMCDIRKKNGKNKMITAVLNSVALALGTFVAIRFMGVIYA